MLETEVSVSVPVPAESFTVKPPGPTIAPRTSTSSQQYSATPAIQPAAQERVIEQIADDRLSLEAGDTILLIVEDDPHYARVLVDLARDRGFKVLVAARGSAWLYPLANLAHGLMPFCFLVACYTPNPVFVVISASMIRPTTNTPASVTM